MGLEYGCVVPHPPLILPAVGQGQERRISATVKAFHDVAKCIAAIAPETIVVITPHSVMYSDYIHISPGETASGSFADFGAPQARFEKNYDSAFVSALCHAAASRNINAGTLGEKDWHLDHGTMVPLYFIDQYYTDYKLVRVSISGLSFTEHYRFGQCIMQVANKLGRKTVIVASGDLSHKLIHDGPYGYAPEGPDFDRQVTQALREGNFGRLLDIDETLCEAAAECGLRAVIMLAGALDGRAVTPEFFSYEGPFGVGYGVCGYRIGDEDKGRRFADSRDQEQKQLLETIRNKEDAYVKLARLSLETYVKTGSLVQLPNDLPEDMRTKKAGVFVSLKKDGRLRGCIGTIEPAEESIAEEIRINAVSAGTGDMRFDVVTVEELPELVYSVDVLSEPEPAESLDALDVRRYGVIVSKGRRRGLLLPNLPGVTTPQQQVSIALRKAGISANDRFTMQRFEVVRHT